MTSAQIRILLNNALDEFYVRDSLLVYNFATERACVARIAGYLQRELDKIKHAQHLCVDCEYGAVVGNDGELFKKYMDNVGAYSDSDKQKDRFFPDLIVHERGQHNNNILVVDFKGWWNNETWDNDRKKLEKLTTHSHQQKQKSYFCYQHGVFIALGRQQAYFVEFENGQQISTTATIDELCKRKENL